MKIDNIIIITIIVCAVIITSLIIALMNTQRLLVNCDNVYHSCDERATKYLDGMENCANILEDCVNTTKICATKLGVLSE